MKRKKEYIFFLILLVSFLLTGCSKEKTVLCELETNKVVFHFDKNEYVSSIYTETLIDVNDYYDEYTYEDDKTRQVMLSKTIDELITNCYKKEYACSSNYENYLITHKVYVKNYKEARLNDLDNYYGISYDNIIKELEKKDAICNEITDNKQYIISENTVTININNKIYNSIEEMNKDMNKPEYYKKYTLIELDDKKATIEFKEDGKCEINLHELDQEVFNHVYCDKEKKQRKMGKVEYIDGNCSYTVHDKYYFDIIYDGKLETGSYCEGLDENNLYTKDVINKNDHLITIKFNNSYDDFTYENGYWNYRTPSHVIEYK